MELLITDRVRDKIETGHRVGFLEAEEAFFNSDIGEYLLDDRTAHQTKPPTYWTLSFTTEGRLLKLVVKFDWQENVAWLRTAYEPNKEEIELYEANT
jgi:hypothetical protein